MPPYFLALKKYAKKMRKFVTKICLATKQRKFLVGKLGVLVVILVFIFRIVSVLFIIPKLLVCLLGILVGVFSCLFFFCLTLFC